MNLLSTSPMATLGLLAQKVSEPLDPTQTGTYWFPPSGSTLAPQTDWAFYYIYWISVVFTALIVGVMIFFMLRYRHRKNWDGEESANHGLALEITWSVIPFLLTIVMWWKGVESYMFSDVMPQNAMEIQVKGRQWNWSFVYPNGMEYPELHVPVDQPVVFVLSSADVIHSFWVPAWRVKKDVVPGRYNKTWVEATLPGNYTLLCTEYCGKDHSAMMAPVVVHDSAANIATALAAGQIYDGERQTFEDWYAETTKVVMAQYEGLSPSEIGQMVHTKKGCNACHSVDGTASVGPTWKGVWGSMEKLEGGGAVLVDENYVQESIYDPGAKLVLGYAPLMSTYRGVVDSQEIDGIIAYLKDLAK